jgi:ATP phosphoribosyltransferase
LKKLKIAIQKSGRLNEKSVELLRNSGFQFDNYKSSLISTVSNFPLEILFLRDDDIPEYVQDGIADLGIVGLNIIEETEMAVDHLIPLGFGKCSLKIAVPNHSPFTRLEDLNGKSIATSYPRTLHKFLVQENLSCEIRTISGSVEISTNLGLSDAICDLVSSGGTLKSNGLIPFSTILQSEAILIGYPKIEKKLLGEILVRVKSVLKARETKYVVLNAEEKNLEAITQWLPGVKSPSILPLAEKGWFAIHTVIPETDFWEIINNLKSAGAQGIVVMPIEKIIL